MSEQAPKNSRNTNPYSDEAIEASRQKVARMRLATPGELADSRAEAADEDHTPSMDELEKRQKKETSELIERVLVNSKTGVEEGLKVLGDGIISPEVEALIKDARELEKASEHDPMTSAVDSEGRMIGKFGPTTDEKRKIARAYQKANNALRAPRRRSEVGFPPETPPPAPEETPAPMMY